MTEHSSVPITPSLRIAELEMALLASQLHLRRVQRLNQDLTHVIDALIHQLRMMTTRATNFLGVTRRTWGTPPPAAEHAAHHVEHTLDQLMTVLGSVDDYMQLRHWSIWEEHVDLARLLPGILAEVRMPPDGSRVRCTYDPLPTLSGDRHALTRILVELLSNALKFTRTCSAARIHIHVLENDVEHVIGVSDNGVGFDMRHVGRLFQLFGRLHPSREYEGVGVGLVTVRQVVERIGGRAWAEGEVGRGATVWLAWPKALPPTVPA
ncbi:hypothetical protein E7T09_08415 [Deinococcus sp. KSM4-11]|uniref:sensor histidine kinase n=1 Tax=Deinococcus sp. KSM4-11 TaxID=2568654 RepID=UPI0010A36B6F|nr:sensor histidine kinase [Deinococcus sp. KSM4-11]THF87170.1 hypothetical protein E7T09_08415 [Deinococcus sp. KSM4-11]